MFGVELSWRDSVRLRDAGDVFEGEKNTDRADLTALGVDLVSRVGAAIDDVVESTVGRSWNVQLLGTTMKT